MATESDAYTALLQCVAEQEKKAQEEQRAREQEQMVADRARERLMAYENAHWVEKLRLSRAIFEWGEQFRQTDAYARIVELDRFGMNGIWLCGGGHGHLVSIEKTEPYARWSRFYLQLGSVLSYFYWAGCKWMAGIRRVTYTDPEQLAKEISYWYLQDVHGKIVDDGIYKTIARQLEKK